MSLMGQSLRIYSARVPTFVRCWSNSRQTRARAVCPLSATSGLMHRSKWRRYSITSSVSASSCAGTSRPSASRNILQRIHNFMFVAYHKGCRGYPSRPAWHVGLGLAAYAGQNHCRGAQPMSLLGQKRTNHLAPKSSFVRFGQPAQPVDATLYRRGKR